MYGATWPYRLDQRVLGPQRFSDFRDRHAGDAQADRELSCRHDLSVYTADRGGNVCRLSILRWSRECMSFETPGTHVGPGQARDLYRTVLHRPDLFFLDSILHGAGAIAS